MNHGTRPTRLKHTDFDFLKSHKFGIAVKPQIPNELFCDAGLLMQNQEARDDEFTPPVPPLPFGCTDYATADIATDLTKMVRNPLDLEAVTNANAQGGIDIRVAMDAGRRLNWFKQYFNIRASGMLDWFESFQVAQVTGVAAGEARAISFGTPWFDSWQKAAFQGQAIMPMPTKEELDAIHADNNAFPWHNSVLDGFTSKNGVLLYRDKSWQGNQVGDRGFLYFPREVINMVMTIPGTVAYVPSNTPVANPLPVDLPTLRWLVSFLQTFLEKLRIKLQGIL